VVARPWRQEVLHSQVRCSVLQCVAVCCNVMQCVAVVYSVLQCVVCCVLRHKVLHLQCVAVYCSLWQEVLHSQVRCIVLQCVALCCSVV